MIFNRLKHQCGFTLLEIILTMIIISIVLGIASEVMMKQADAYSYVNNRKSALQDARFALHHIKEVMEKIDGGDLITITSTSVSYVDDVNMAKSFSLGTDGSSLGLYAGSKLLVGQLQNFWIDYFDGNGTPLVPTPGTVNLVRRMAFNLQTEPKSGEGSITMTMEIVPRDFLGYKNFQ